MGHRSKMALTLSVIGLIGFILGIVANIIYSKALPVLIETFPQILASEWIAWGLVGALLAIMCSLIYAYLP